MKRIKTLTALLLFFILIFQLFGCAVKVPDPVEVSTEDEALAMGFSVGEYDGDLKVGEYTWLNVNLKIDYEYALEWYSEDPKIATVDSSGRVDAVSVGSTKVYAKANKCTVEYDINVTKAKSTVLSSSTAYTDNESVVQQNLAVDSTFAKPYAILVNLKTGCATVYTYNNYGTYSKAVRAMVCSVGKGDSSTEGSYSIESKERWHREDGKYYQYYTSFSNENGELAFSSTSYEDDDPSTLVTSEYNKLGTAFTTGDILFSADDAKWIYDNCTEGTLVKITNSDNADPIGKPEPIRIAEASEHQTWDPTDPDENNPYAKVTPEFGGTEDVYIPLNGNFDYLSGVVAYDSGKNSFTNGITVDGTVTTTREGEYVITYYFTDSLKRQGRADRHVFVVSQEEYDEITATAATK